MKMCLKKKKSLLMIDGVQLITKVFFFFFWPNWKLFSLDMSQRPLDRGHPDLGITEL